MSLTAIASELKTLGIKYKIVTSASAKPASKGKISSSEQLVKLLSIPQSSASKIASKLTTLLSKKLGGAVIVNVHPSASKTTHVLSIRDDEEHNGLSVTVWLSNDSVPTLNAKKIIKLDTKATLDSVLPEIKAYLNSK